MKAQIGSRSIALLFFNFGTRWRWGGGAKPLPGHFAPEKEMVTNCTGR